MELLDVLNKASYMFSMNIQYFHCKDQKFTAAVDVPFTRQDLEEIVSTPHLKAALMIGIAKKHPKDRYCKATGRTIALGKLEQVIFELEHIGVERKTKRLVYQFYCPEKFMMVHIRTSHKSDKPHVILVTHPNF